MSFEQVWPLLLIVPPALWMIFDFNRSRSANQFAVNIFGTLLVSAFCLPGFALKESNMATEALTQALTGLSDTDLRQGRVTSNVVENAEKPSKTGLPDILYQYDREYSAT